MLNGLRAVRKKSSHLLERLRERPYGSFSRVSFSPRSNVTLSPLLGFGSRRESVSIFSRNGHSYATKTSSRPASETFLSGANTSYIEEMYVAWHTKPSSVDPSWVRFFESLEKGVAFDEAISGVSFTQATSTSDQRQPVGQFLATTDRQSFEKQMKVQLLIRAYQMRGHEIANIDPLQLEERRRPSELDLATYGFTEADLDEMFIASTFNIQSGYKAQTRERKLRDIVKTLEESYCRTIGIEYMHMNDRNQVDWIRERVELERPQEFTKAERLIILDRLIWATNFEQFLAKKFSTAKRFGLEGGESLIPGLKALIDASSEYGVNNVVIGMAHRGRLNVLGNVVLKPFAHIFHEFEHGVNVPDEDTEQWGASGDVKYHLGTNLDRKLRSGKMVHISVLSNPSHLEAVNPVVEGKTRAKQYYNGDSSGSTVMPIQIHGDASFVGQGVVYETINASRLKDYTTGGTVHVVINNQIGFTTVPQKSRGGMYCTMPVMMTGTPVFHVNANDPEAVVRVMNLAAQFRAEFHMDVCVDLVCYRRFGHNEMDDPAFTQPAMYKKIRSTKTALEIYKNELISKGIIEQSEYDSMNQACIEMLNKGFEQSKNYVVRASDWLESRWHGFKGPVQRARIKPTSLNMDTLQTIGAALTRVPDGFTLHRNLGRMMEARKTMFKTGKGIDWATAEALAFGSLLLEGNHVRLAGQDIERGTFSQRHAVLVDQETSKVYIPLNNIPNANQQIHLVNSFLSEFACLGFELGYSLESPNALVCWEGQFGDFANGAQVIIDQFISCGEHKWYRQTGLTLLLPHGYEGQGPEHSSARVERFLQLADTNSEVIVANQDLLQRSNWAVVNCSTPANYFHVLRRQIHREYRKPLIIATPKSLLRHPLCKSNLSDFDSENQSSFQPVIGEISPDLLPDEQIRRLIFCTGKVFWDLYQERHNKGIKDIAIVRIEQLAPFPFRNVVSQIQKYPNASIVWAQEEHKNMGAWNYIYFYFLTCIREARNTNEAPVYVGRGTSASPATGSPQLHKLQYEKLVRDAFN